MDLSDEAIDAILMNDSNFSGLEMASPMEPITFSEFFDDHSLPSTMPFSNSKTDFVPAKKRKNVDNASREERNMREQKRSQRISRVISEIRNQLLASGRSVPSNKIEVLCEVKNFIKQYNKNNKDYLKPYEGAKVFVMETDTTSKVSAKTSINNFTVNKGSNSHSGFDSAKTTEKLMEDLSFKLLERVGEEVTYQKLFMHLIEKMNVEKEIEKMTSEEKIEKSKEITDISNRLICFLTKMNVYNSKLNAY